MIIKIYDYDNKPTEVVISDDKAISAIFVNILSGDETGIIMFADGSFKRFDASNHRMHSFYDGSYVVTGEDISRWNEFKSNGTISYSRKDEFDEREPFYYESDLY
jgi:hypothetical protein